MILAGELIEKQIVIHQTTDPSDSIKGKYVQNL